MAGHQISEAQLRAALIEKLAATHVEITDTSGGCGQSFTALIVSPQFRGLSSLKRHRAVNGAVREEIVRIHAWSARCKTPEEWEAEVKASGEVGGGEGDRKEGGTVVEGERTDERAEVEGVRE